MERRKFIKTSLATLAALPILNFPPGRTMNREKHQFQLGSFKCTIFKDLMFKYQAKDYFINAPADHLAIKLKKYQLVPEHIPSPYVALLLQDGVRNILVDSGIGFSETPIVFRGKEFVLKGQLQHLLQAEGIEKESITDVVLTHFHPDHIGGVFTTEGQLNFPNAQFHIHEKEWEYWHSSKSMGQPPLFRYFIEKNVTALNEQDLHFIKGDFVEILPGITAILADGHTPGQMALLIGEEQEQLLYISDAFLHPIHIEQLDWQTNYDLNHKKAKKTRLKLLDLAYQDNVLIHAFHFDFPGLGRVGKIGKQWKWQFES